MNKTITIITGGIVTITLSVFLILGKIDLQTFGTLTTAILGVVYGFYQKIEKEELNQHLIGSKNTVKLLEVNNKELKTDFNIVNTRLNELLDNIELSKQNIKKSKIK